MDLVGDPATASELASPYGVSPDIHSEDFIFQFHLDARKSDLRQAMEVYFMDGQRSAERLDELITRFHPGGRRLSLLEFASGYGCVSRHLKKLDKYDLVSCDIHKAAVDFLQQHLGVQGLLSAPNPDNLHAEPRFDVVFALSFFSHIPHTTFYRWVRKLFDFVADGGILVFTTHGRVGRSQVGNPALEPEGYWFAPVSEQKDLPVQDYGTMITSPFYVFRAQEQDPLAKPLFFQEAFWWGTQDTYIVQKSAPAELLDLPATTLESRVRAIEAEVLALRLATAAFGAPASGSS